MGRKLDHPEHGVLYERQFAPVQLDQPLQHALEQARKSGHLVEYGGEPGQVLVQRRWREGKTLDEYFREMSVSERKKNAVDVYKALTEQLRQLHKELEHGAVHPGNVILDQGLVLVDAVSNSAHMGIPPSHGAQYMTWLWRNTPPPSWSWHQWDQVCLLRMCTLLAQEPDRWHGNWSMQDMLQACSSWVAEATELLTPGSDVATQMHEALGQAQGLPNEPDPVQQPAAAPAFPPQVEHPQSTPLQYASTVMAPASPYAQQQQSSQFPDTIPEPQPPQHTMPPQYPQQAPMPPQYPQQQQQMPPQHQPPPQQQPPQYAQPIAGQTQYPQGTPIQPVPTGPQQYPPAQPAPGQYPQVPQSGGYPPAQEAAPDPDEQNAEMIRNMLSQVRTMGGANILEATDEQQILTVCAEKGIANEMTQSVINVWLKRNRVARANDLSVKAEQQITRGVQHGKWVKESALRNATRTYTNQKLSEAKAAEKIRRLLEDNNLIDERAIRADWVPRLDAFLNAKCKKNQYKAKQFMEMITILASFGIPGALAEQWVKHYLDKHGFTEKSGWF